MSDYDEGIDAGARNVLGLGARGVRWSPVRLPYVDPEMDLLKLGVI
jgi:hypothetical protein